ncbi:hypothetical protein QOT17_012893 [Balamuthia mandrillaris]
MKRSLCVLVVLSCVLSALSVNVDDLPTNLQNGYVAGRSGDIVVHHPTSDDGLMVFLGNGKTTYGKDTIQQTRVGDLLAHSLGLPPLNPHLDRSDFPVRDFFNAPKANLMVVLDSASASDLPSLQGKKSSQVLKESYPSDSIASLTSLLTGTSPSEHGISGSSWFSRSRNQRTEAYEVWCPGMAGAKRASLQDMITITYGGQALLVSASADRQHARAMSAKPYVLPEGDSSRNLGFFLQTGSFVSVYDDEDQVNPLQMDERAIRLFLASSNDYLISKFDLSSPADFAFLSEIAFAHRLLEVLSSDSELRQWTQDTIPDFYFLAFSGLDAVRTAYGADSEQSKAAFHMVERTITELISGLEKIYNSDNVVGQVLVMTEKKEEDSEKKVMELVKSALNGFLSDEVHFEDYYPNIYLKDSATVPLTSSQFGEDSTPECLAVKSILKQFSSIECFCLPRLSDTSILFEQDGFYQMRRQQSGSGSASGSSHSSSSHSGSHASSSSSSGSDDGPTDEEVDRFQVVLWASVILVLVTISATLIMLTIDASTDTMLYQDSVLDHSKFK